MPKDAGNISYRATQVSASALIAMAGSLRKAEAITVRVGKKVSHVTLSSQAQSGYSGYNRDTCAAFCVSFAEEYSADEGVPYSDALQLTELWLNMMDAASDGDPEAWDALVEEAEELLRDRDDMFSNMLRFSIRFHLPRSYQNLPNGGGLYEAENMLRRSIARSDFGLADHDFDGVLSIETETYYDDAVETELRREAEVELGWQRDKRFCPTGIILSTALIQLLQLATLRGQDALTEFLRGLAAEGRLPLLFVRGRIFNEKYALIAAAEAIAETASYVVGAPAYIAQAISPAVKMIEHVAREKIEDIPGYDVVAGDVFKEAVNKGKGSR